MRISIKVVYLQSAFHEFVRISLQVVHSKFHAVNLVLLANLSDTSSQSLVLRFDYLYIPRGSIVHPLTP